MRSKWLARTVLAAAAISVPMAGIATAAQAAPQSSGQQKAVAHPVTKKKSHYEVHYCCFPVTEDTGRGIHDFAWQYDSKHILYVQDAAGSQTPADQLTKLVGLRDQGVITGAEFEQEKAKILAAGGGNPLPGSAGERAAQDAVR